MHIGGHLEVVRTFGSLTESLGREQNLSIRVPSVPSWTLDRVAYCFVDCAQVNFLKRNSLLGVLLMGEKIGLGLEIHWLRAVVIVGGQGRVWVLRGAKGGPLS